MRLRVSIMAACAIGACALAACSGGGRTAAGMTAIPPVTGGGGLQSNALSLSGTSILKRLDDERTVGSAVDPVTGDVNPYGLDIAKVTSGKIEAGDLVVCDFNDSSNVQGTGNAILTLDPIVGSVPRSLVHSTELLGCNALATAPTGPIWAASFADDNPIFSASGALLNTLEGGPWRHPFGETFAPPFHGMSAPAFYVSNAGDGSLVRVTVLPGPAFRFTIIARGFPINGGAPGSILAPSGLNYESSDDRLYVVDGQNNALYAIDNVSQVDANGIMVHDLAFTGKDANRAHVIFHGAPLNGPISSALLPGGNVAIGNTLDPNGFNLMVEVSRTGALLDVKNVDTGASGAIFGMVASGATAGTVKLYFNDDNDNTVKVLTP